MSGGRLIRPLLPFERQFTQLPNEWLRDKRLSYKARGLLALLMTHDTGWKVTIKQLAAEAERDGEHAIGEAVKELEQHGYLIRRRARRGGQFTADDWEIADPSGLSEPALIGYREAGLATVGENRRRRSTEGENRRRTEGENRLPIRTQEEESKTYKSNHRGEARNCVNAPGGQHDFMTTGWCTWCDTRAPLLRAVES